mmetsp:Transcript_60134/g.143318  ORF Transcript_60134/g.143318 Transcript_60134/m.143318 type:complete len:377 (-) Transcript_60134:188-1318(-)|eukprot:CAMPEP_0178402378 /NCGR_PEP_ID=MMETSP0689_2-20121128/16809_1 /TAXON_ID=160604 /ORGANISM="Amphidinium massartii, Strain CS-259" /LENGTH=376 /DNA_ID=CAMNT_0020023273 /DNA_START=408 /DNA_END=1538 /DNA_ORIENTATION=+
MPEHGSQLEVTSSSSSSSPSVSSLLAVDPLDFDAWAPVAIIASVLLLMVPGLLLYTTMWCSSRQMHMPKSPVSTSRRLGQQWLLCLTIANFFLLALQVGLGRWANCLSLLADSAHSLADCAMFCFAFFLECVKLRFGEDHSSQDMVRRLDRVSGLFSIVVVMLTTMMVTIQALMRLQSTAAAAGKDQSEDMIGPALLIFSTLTLLVNAGLVYLQYVWSHRAQEEEAATMTCEGCSEDYEHEPLMPKSKRQSPPCKIPGCQDAECSGLPPKAGGAQPSARDRIATMAHTFLHPGCNSAHGHCSSGENFNLTGVNLHILTDLARTFLMLAAGMLVSCHLVGDQARADAACACVVCVCVVVGSFALLSTYFKKAPHSEV